MTRRTFESHRPRRPEIEQYVQEAQVTVQDPDVVAEAHSGAVALFRYGLGRNEFRGLYLRVIVYYRGKPEAGTVATYHFTDEIGDVQIIEHRYQWVLGARFKMPENRP